MNMKDPLQNRIISEDMSQIYAARSWDELKGCCVYISGAAGMIASYTVLFLIYLNETHGYDMALCLGIRSREKAERRFGLYMERPYIRLITDDVTVPLPDDVLPQYIIHAASLASPQYYGSIPVETMLPNVVGTHQLLAYARKHPVRGFLFYSAGAVYGTISGVPDIDENVQYGSFDFLAPGNCYSESKRCGEALCKMYYLEYGIPTVSARIYHTYGPTLDITGDHRVFSEFVGNVIAGKDIVLTSDGSTERPFCYLSDATVALLTMLLDGARGECYNMCNDQAYISIRDLAETLTSLFPEKHLKIVYRPRQETGYILSPEKMTLQPSSRKLCALGWQPRVAIADGFRRTILALTETDQV